MSREKQSGVIVKQTADLRIMAVGGHVAQIQITSFGYDTEVRINGISKHRITDNAIGELVIGGLNANQNKISITTRPIKAPAGDDADEEEIPRKLEVTVFALPNEEGAEAHKAWHYEPKKVPPSYRGIFFAMPR